MRPIDMEYAAHPEKRQVDFEELKKRLSEIEPAFKKAEAVYLAGKMKEAVFGFIIVAAHGSQILFLYEALGFSFKNRRFNYPHYLIYKLESHLQGTKQWKKPDGTTVTGPADPEGAEILQYTGLVDESIRRTLVDLSHPIETIDYEKIDAKAFYSSAQKIVGFINEYVLSEKELLEHNE